MRGRQFRFSRAGTCALVACLALWGCADNHLDGGGSADEWDVGEGEREAGETNGGMGPFAERASDGRYCRVDYIERDLDGDGEIDQRADAVYEEGGAVRVFEVDGGPDGSVDNLELTERDAAGRVVREQSASGFAQGGYTERRRYEYGARGLLTRETYDENLDGMLEEEFTFEYDEQRRRTRLEYVGTSSYSTYSYNEAGAEMVTENWDGDHLYSRNVTRWEFDQQGRKVREERYVRTRDVDDGLGPIDTWTSWRYEDGELVEEVWSAEGDSATSVMQWTYRNGLIDTGTFDHVELEFRTDWYTWECSEPDGRIESASP